MRVLLAATLSVLISGVNSPISAQQKAAALNGVWHNVETHIVRPDSTVTRPGSPGMTIFLNGRFVNLWTAYRVPSGRQAAPSTVEEKAARYDALTANAGRFEVVDSTVSGRYEHAKNPAGIGTTFKNTYRLVGDTLWVIVVSPWANDTTKQVRNTSKWVREK